MGDQPFNQHATMQEITSARVFGSANITNDYFLMFSTVAGHIV